MKIGTPAGQERGDGSARLWAATVGLVAVTVVVWVGIAVLLR